MSEAQQRPSDLVRDTLPGQVPAGQQMNREALEDAIYEALREVVDPELMVNIVDLGLIYDLQIDEDRNVTIDMTLTTPVCPLTDQIEIDAQDVLAGLVKSVTINWVWMPPWTLDRITDEGREQLRYIGFNV